MGQCPTRRSGGRFRGRPKKGLQTALEGEVAQEVEALLGREALAELDFEALEVTLRQGTLRLAAHAIEQRLNADLPMKRARRIVLVGTQRVMLRAGPRMWLACWVPCDSSAPTITAPPVATATVLAMSSWG